LVSLDTPLPAAERRASMSAVQIGSNRVGAEAKMAQIILGLGTSHGPQLLMPPELWELRAQADRQNKQHWFRGKSYDFPTLAALRQPDGFAAQITPPAMRAHYDRCQQAMGTVADIYATAALDIAVIIGNDQGEIFTDENIPAFSVFFGREHREFS
jgi:hypothetical protein